VNDEKRHRETIVGPKHDRPQSDIGEPDLALTPVADDRLYSLRPGRAGEPAYQSHLLPPTLRRWKEVVSGATESGIGGDKKTRPAGIAGGGSVLKEKRINLIGL